MNLLKKENIYSILKLLALSVPIIFLFWLINTYGVNSVVWDDFEPIRDYINIVTTGKIDWSAIIAFHNEHRIVIPRIIMLIMAYFTHYNTKVLMMFSACLLCCSYILYLKFVIGKRIKDFNLYDIFFAIIIGFCLFNTAQYENLLWGFHIAWFIIEFCVITGLISLSLYINTLRKKYLYWAILLAITSSFSSLHGLAIWPCYLIVIFIYQFSEKKFDKNIWLYLLSWAVLSFVLYFTDYPEISHHLSGKASSVWQIILFVVRNAGGVLFVDDIQNFCLIAGAIQLIISGGLFLILLKNKKIKQNIVPIGLITYSLGFAFMIALGRSGWIVMSSRYLTYPLLIVIANLTILKQFMVIKNKINYITIILFALLTELCLYVSYDNLRICAFLYEQRQNGIVLMQNYTEKNPKDMEIVYPFASRDEMLERIGKIKENNLSIFYK